LKISTRGYPKVSGFAALRRNCSRWYSFVPLDAVVSLFCDILVSFAAITLCVASQRVFVVVVVVVVVVYFVINSVRKLLYTPSYESSVIVLFPSQKFP
jgi:hypothetical protein